MFKISIEEITELIEDLYFLESLTDDEYLLEAYESLIDGYDMLQTYLENKYNN